MSPMLPKSIKQRSELPSLTWLLTTACTLMQGMLFLMIPLPDARAQFHPRPETRRSGAQIKRSREAERQFREALSRKKNGDLKSFIRKIHEVRNQYPNWLVKSNRQDGLFIGVEKKALNLLFSLGQKGQTLYRKMYDKQARRLLRETGSDPSVEQLMGVYEQYPLTAAAREALRRVSNRHIKQAHFQKALPVLRSLLRVSFSKEEKAQIAARYMFCLSQLGRVPSLDRFSSGLSEKVLDHSILWRDQSRPLRNLRSTLIATAKKQNRSGKEQPGSSSRHNWTAAGGNPTHNRYHGPDVRFNDLSLRISFTPGPGATRRYRQLNGKFKRRTRTRSNIFGFFPVVADRRVFITNGLTIWSWPFPPDSSGSPPANRQPWELLQNSTYQAHRLLYDNRLVYPGTYGEGLYFSPAVTDLGNSEQKMLRLQVTYPIPWRSLYAIDTDSGKVKWKRGGSSGTKSFFQGTSFPAGAVYRDGILYAAVTKFNTSKDTPDLFAVALDPKDGTLLWKSFLTKNMLSSNLFENPIREVIPSVAAVGEKYVFVSTNVGCLVALNRKTGNYQWLYRYVQRRFPQNKSIRPIRQRLLWRNNLPVLSGDTLLVTPPDATHLLALDRESGRIKWKHHYDTLHEQLKSYPRWMIPLGPNGYILAGEQSLGVYSLEQGAMISRRHRPKNEIKGRPAASRDYLYLPTEGGIEKVRYRRPEGESPLVLESKSTFRPRKEYVPGNLFLTGNSLMSISSERFLLYVEQRE